MLCMSCHKVWAEASCAIIYIYIWHRLQVVFFCVFNNQQLSIWGSLWCMRYPFQDDCTDIPEEDVEAADSHEDPMRTTMNHGLVIEVVMGKNSTRCIPFQGNQLRRPWEVREKPCIATIAREVKATSTSQNCPSTSWILATLRLCKWCDLVIYHKLDNLLHVWMTCRPARQVSLLLPSSQNLTDPDLEYQSTSKY